MFRSKPRAAPNSTPLGVPDRFHDEITRARIGTQSFQGQSLHEQDAPQMTAQSVASVLLDSTPDVGRAIRFQSVHISGPLDLTNARIEKTVEFVQCKFDERITLVDAEAKSLIFDRCSLHSVNMSRLRGEGILAFFDCSISDAANLDSIRVSDSIILRCTKFQSGLSARNASSEFYFDLSESNVDGDLDLERLIVGADMFFVKSKITSFEATPSRGVNLRNCQIRGQLIFDGTSLHANLDMYHATVGEDVIFAEAKLAGAELNLSYVRSGGTLAFMELPLASEAVQIRLCNASARTFGVDEYIGQRKLRFNLNGFQYEHLYAPLHFGFLSAILKSGSPPEEDGERVSVRPYNQMSSVLRNAGNRRLADQIQVEKHRRNRPNAWAVPIHWLVDKLYDEFLGYGYKPGRLLLWSIAFVLLAASIFEAAYRAGAIRPTDASQLLAITELANVSENPPPTYAPFNSLAYTFDLFIPLVDFAPDLRVAEYWRPDSAVASIRSNAVPPFPDGSIVLVMRWKLLELLATVVSLVGAVATLLMVLGFSGRLRKD